MNLISKRDSSASPSRSTEFGKRQPLLKKRLDKQSKEDVKVFSSLPPNVEGDIKFYLRLKLLNINLVEPNVKQPINNIKKPIKQDNLIAKCLWWGEENSTGAIFRPKIQSKYFKTEDKIQTTAIYMVRSGAKQFSAYLNDMRTLDIDLINETSQQIIARLQLFEIGQLTSANPIKGYFAAFDESQKKIADVNILIELEPVKPTTELIKKQETSDTSRPTTPASQANLNDFQIKYEKFEKNQLKKQQITEPTITKSKFDSIYYKTNEPTDTHSNPVISALIQRAEKIKSDLIKSSTTNLYENKLDDYDVDLNLEESIIYEPSYLFDKLEYFNQLNTNNDDKELNELLNPTGLLTKLIETKTNQINPSIDYFKHEQPQRPYSTTNSVNYSSEDENNYKPNKNVSFEIQSSSDGESSNDNDLNCVDSLSPQRLSLLNLVQIAQLKIDFIDFYSSFSTNILKSIENDYQQRLDEKRFNSKPPKATKSDLNQNFFIEYQFPVVNSTNNNEVLNATQVMRVVPKRAIKSSDKIYFEHCADYSVLFTSKSLENWWRSHVIFKIYMRSAQTKTPILIGMARLRLKNLLKSRNFKLIKKLAVLDKLNQSEKRIGTLNVSIELTSDLNEFKIDLQKLKNNENYKSNINSNKSKPKTNIKPNIQSNTSLNHYNSIDSNISKQETGLQSEQTFSIDFYLSINESRDFGSFLKGKIYLVCRLFWNREKIKLESNLNMTWSLNLSFMIKKSLVDNMRNNFMIIEVWSQQNMETTSNDSLIGTLKLPLQEFYLKFNDFNLLKHQINDSMTYTQPTIGVNGWVSVLDPFTGFKSGEFNLILAMGSNKQILNLQKLLFDQARLRSVKQSTTTSDTNEHILILKLDQLKLQPLSDDLRNDESDYYIKYSFLDETNNTFKSFLIGSKLNKNFDNSIEHKFNLKETKQEFFNFMMSKYEQNDFIRFELWKRSYFPNLREKYLARGEVLTEKFYSLILGRESTSSFIIPLISEDCQSSDKFLGQLFIDLEYKYVENVQKPISNVTSSALVYNNDSLSDIILSVNVLRASRLQTLIETVATKSNIRSINLENSEVYVKFSLAFLNKPLDFKQTHRVVTKLNGYSPEFFEYFELVCPLVSIYNSFNKRTVSLAEQIELGQVIFEIWSKYSNPTNQNCTEVLLGTCNVPLEALLDNRIGIRGWLPIQSTFYSSNHKTLELSEHSVSGGLEIAIRFTKHDDYLKIIESAREIGWQRGAQLINNLIQNVKNKKKELEIQLNEEESQPPIIPLTTTSSSSTNRKTVKCLIEIDKAVHLPTVFDRELNTNISVNSYVSFNLNIDNPCEIMKTTLCEHESSPKWNQQFLVNIDSEYFLDDKKYFVLKIWHKSGRQQIDKLIGCASIDMTPLLCGLSHLSGWYNIQDSTGNCCGQIKINILPQENLFSLKKIVQNRKKCLKESDCNRMTSFRFESCLNTSASTMSLPRFLTSTERTSPNKQVNKQSNSTLDLSQINLDDYKSGLKQKLNELEQLNKKLKEKLELQTNINISRSEQSLNNLKVYEKNEDIKVIELVETNDEKVINEIELSSKSPSLIQTDNDEENDKNEVIEQERLNNEEIYNYDYERSFNQIEQVNQIASKVIDSFWINSEKSSISEHENNEEINKVEKDKKEIILEEKNHEEMKEESSEPDETNETYLDQTVNFNSSVELFIQNRIDLDEDKIEQLESNLIDCNKLEYDIGETNEDQDDKIADDNDILTKQIQQEDNQQVDEVEESENLTIIMPEQLNQIEKEDIEPLKEISKLTSYIEPEVIINDKLKGLSSKIPNYFLAQDDLETKMRKLHYNYVQISNVNESKNERRQEKKIESTKSTLNLINESSSKQDLDRINKIFYSKFNT